MVFAIKMKNDSYTLLLKVTFNITKCSTEFKNQEFLFFRGVGDREDEPKVSVCANSFGYPLRTLE